MVRTPLPGGKLILRKLSSMAWELLWRCLEGARRCFQGFPHTSVGKESACNAGGPSSIPGSGRSSAEGKGYPLQYSGLETFHGLYSPWSHKQLDMIERLSLTHSGDVSKLLVVLLSYNCNFSLGTAWM